MSDRHSLGERACIAAAQLRQCLDAWQADPWAALVKAVTPQRKQPHQ